MCLQLLTTHQIHDVVNTIYECKHLKFRHREVRLLIFRPEPTDPRVSNHVHRGDPGVLWGVKERETRRCYPR